MSKTHCLTGVAALSMLLAFGCGQHHSAEKNGHPSSQPAGVSTNTTHDSLALMNAFEALKSDKKFLSDLALENETQYSFSDLILKPFFGDLDGDGVTDALVAFSVEGRGGGSSSDLHYAVFLNQDNQWKYQSQLDGDTDRPDWFIGFEAIENGKITGQIVADKDESLPGIPVEYVFEDGKLINTSAVLNNAGNIAPNRPVVDAIALPDMDFGIERFGENEITNDHPLSDPEIPKLQIEAIDQLENRADYPGLHYYLLREIYSGKEGKIMLISRVSEMEQYAWLACYDPGNKLIDFKTVYYDEWAESAHNITSITRDHQLTVSEYCMNLETGEETTKAHVFYINGALKFAAVLRVPL